ncbi:MAG TPA: endonuclease/exonuclease/phosphatase family protein [Pirellula sp.]|nr:endonuclease/exonuclease/phosphatase family protein [Pirellula sp.]
MRVTVTLFALYCWCTAYGESAKGRITTWNLEWFPNGSPKELAVDAQNVRIRAAASVVRELDPDILLLQEVKNYDACVRLADAIQPGFYQIAICSAFRDTAQPFLAKQQIAILAKYPAQAAWAEPWKSMEGIDPPRGFAFAWFKIGSADIGVYSVHLKSNLVRVRDKDAENAKNIRKREIAAGQLLAHMHDMIGTAIPSIKVFIVGGDFNTNKDQDLFSKEDSLTKLMGSGFRNCMGGLPFADRITHPARRQYPDATFDYLLGKNVTLGKPIITKSGVSDHLPVTCDITIAPTLLQPVVAKTSSPATDEPQTVTLTQPVTIQIPYGKTVLPRGSRLQTVSRTNNSVVVRYLDGTYVIPMSSTDMKQAAELQQ